VSWEFDVWVRLPHASAMISLRQILLRGGDESEERGDYRLKR
jgi:hypothetical protein